MNHFFLSRLAGDTQTGPQTFTKSNIGDTVNFSPAPPAPEGPGLLNSVLVQNGGVEELNGIFIYITEFDNKPYYNKDGNGNWFIVWFDNQWEIYDFSINFSHIYFSTEDVLYPWNVTIWQSSNSIYNPVPTVTKVL